MSAAEPAHPAPPGINTREDADVIPLTKNRAGRGPTPRSGRWNHMDNHQPPAPPGGGRDRTDHEIVADFVEKAFNGIDRTLSNDETALIFLKSLDVFIHVLAGVTAGGDIDEGQYARLLETLDPLRSAPDLV